MIDRILMAALAIPVLVAGVNDARAAITLEGDEVIVQAHEVIDDDLVIYATYVRVDGIVKGDLTIVGTDVVVEGIVEQDLLVVAKTLYLNGAVNDDARFAVFAAALGEQSRVADDSWALAYSLEAREGSRTGGSLYGAGRQALLAGQIAEDIRVRTGALELRGLTGGSVHAVVGALEAIPAATLVVDVDLEIPDLPDGIRVTDGAAIGGDLDYRSLDVADIWPQATIAGQVRHEPWDAGPMPTAADSFEPNDLMGDPSNEALERLVVLLVLGLALAVAAPRFLAEQARELRDRPIDRFGWGLGALVFAFLASVVLGIGFFILMVVGLSTSLGGLAATAIVAGGMTQASILALSLLALGYLAPVLASAGIGHALLARLRPAWVESAERPLQAMLGLAIGAVAYTALRAIPVLGVVVGIFVALAGLGALAHWLRDRFVEAPDWPEAHDSSAASGPV